MLLHRSTPLATLVFRGQLSLAIFFAAWTLIYPATYLIGRPGVPGYLPTAPAFVAADPSSIARFAKSPLIRLLHCLVGGVWCATAPLQLSSRIRKQYPQVHRLCGRLFFASAAAISAGYILMEERAKDSSQTVMLDHGIHSSTFYRPLATWFTYTAMQAAVAAFQRDICTHVIFCIRHVGAGLTFALGRLLVVLIGALLHYSSLVDMTVYNNKMTWFYICSYSAAALSVGGAELLARVAGKGLKGYSSPSNKRPHQQQQSNLQ
eukprot:GHUV01001916.1.p1 GENE.GHUV01001916.1~~GHUV01001916.1.p1  ORF type:complete len:263 (+),score=60.14 GHUV01001916.1:265-1053(+)